MFYRAQVDAERHELLIEGLVPPRPAGEPIRLQCPTWVPGSYKFQAFARDIFCLRAFEVWTGRPLRVEPEGWQGFRIEGARGPVRVCYAVLGRDREFGQHCGVIDRDVAVVTGARFLENVDWDGPYRVSWELPAGWKIHHPAGASPVADAAAWEYRDYETLVDSPVVLGRFDRLRRNVQGTDFDFVFVDRALGFESEAGAFVDRVALAAAECLRIFGSFPFPSYTFILSTNPENRWGLEHRTSSMCGTGPDVFIDRKATARGVRVCAHELFHAWNARSLRPFPLGKPDLRNGSFTDALWVAEGFTRYYEFLICTRIGLYTAEEFFSMVVNYCNHLRRMPAYGRVSAAASSRSSFLTHGRYQGRSNNSIDYYEKGCLIAFSIDAELRLQRNGDSLDRALGDFYRRFAGRGLGYKTADAIEFFESRCRGLRLQLRRAVLHTASLSLRPHLERLGFRVEKERVSQFGLILKHSRVQDVLDSGQAGRAGIAPGDRILAIDGFAFSSAGLDWVAKRGAQAEWEVLRGHRLLRFRLTAEKTAQLGTMTWTGNEEQARRIREWLRAEFRPRPEEKFERDFRENFHGEETVV